MDIIEDNKKEKAISGIEGGSTPESDSDAQEFRCEHPAGRSLFWLGILTQSVNLVSGVSHNVRYKNSGNQIGKPACVLSRSSYPVRSKTASALLGVHNGNFCTSESDSGVNKKQKIKEGNP